MRPTLSMRTCIPGVSDPRSHELVRYSRRANSKSPVQENAMDRLVHSNELYTDLAQGTLPQFSYLNPGANLAFP